MRTKRHVSVFGLVLGLFLFANQARANSLIAAPATVDCSGFSLSVTLSDLTVGTTYTIDYRYFLTPVSTGITEPLFTGSFDFTATSTTQTVSTTGAWPGTPPPITAPFTVNGQVTLTITGTMLGITFNGTDSQLILLECGVGTGCPATIGFWKNSSKHPFPSSVETSGLTIGGVTYTPAQLLTILSDNGGNAVVILGRQLVGALLNLAAGATDNPTADAAISNAEMLLETNSLNLLTSDVAPGSTLGQQLLADEVTLNNYNNANFQTCSEGSGLTN
jgi:hypothetical protein